MADAEKKTSGNIQSIERAVAVLRCFRMSERLGVTEISRMLALHKSTTFGIMRTLEHCGLLEQERRGLYRLGPELRQAGPGISFGLRTVYLPHLREIAEQTGETVNLMVPSGGDVTYVEKIESPHSMRICTTVGQQYPFYCTAGGKAMAAFFSEERREQLFDELRLVAITANTITDVTALRRELVRVRAAGVAEDHEEMDYGVVCVAVPILDDGEPVAAISVSGPAGRMSFDARRAAREVLLRHAEQIGAALGRSAPETEKPLGQSAPSDMKTLK